MSEYPEHEKLSGVQVESQAIGQFIDWLQDEKGVFLAVEATHKEENISGIGNHEVTETVPYRFRIDEVLAEYFGIDLRVLESERRAMLVEIRMAREGGPR